MPNASEPIIQTGTLFAYFTEESLIQIDQDALLITKYAYCRPNLVGQLANKCRLMVD